MNTHFIKRGDGPPVILVHGIAASSRDWDRLIPELAQAGFQVYAPDLLGHGNSAKPKDPVYYSAESIYAHFESWILNLQLPVPPVLIGHSLGGFLSLSYALRHTGQVEGLFLINPFYTPDQLPHRLRLLRLHPEWGEKALKFAPLWLIRLVTMLDPFDARYCAGDIRIQVARDCKRASSHIAYIPFTLPDLTPRLAELQLPVQVIWGDKDMTLNPHSFPNLVQALPNASGHIIYGRGHKPHRSKPTEAHASILAFLKYTIANGSSANRRGKTGN